MADAILFCPECEQDAPMQKGSRMGGSRRFAEHWNRKGKRCSLSGCTHSDVSSHRILEAAIAYDKVLLDSSSRSGKRSGTLGMLRHAVSVHRQFKKSWGIR